MIELWNTIVTRQKLRAPSLLDRTPAKHARRHEGQLGPDGVSGPALNRLARGFTAEEQLRLEDVMCTAAQLEVLGISGAADGEGHHVMKLQEAAFATASA